MFLKLYSLGPNHLSIEPAKRARPWMKDNPHVYRCGPVVNCNSFGWDIITNHKVSVMWNGGKNKDDLIVQEGHEICHTNFGHGVLTFAPRYTWHTSPGWSLMITPVPNNENDEWSTMWALIETDNLKYPFFPSIQFKKPGRWTLEPRTAIARVIPVQQSKIMDCQPTIEPEPDDFREYRNWQAQTRAKGGYKVQKFYQDNIAEYPVVKMKDIKDERSIDNTQLPE